MRASRRRALLGGHRPGRLTDRVRDLVRTRGLAIEALGVAAVIAAVGMLVVAARRSGGGEP